MPGRMLIISGLLGFDHLLLFVDAISTHQPCSPRLLPLHISAALHTNANESGSSTGVWLLVAVLTLFAIAQLGRVLCDYWLGFWADASEAEDRRSKRLNYSH